MSAPFASSFDTPECLFLWQGIELAFTKNAAICGIQQFDDDDEEYPTQMLLFDPGYSDDTHSLYIWRQLKDGVDEATLIYEALIPEAKTEVYMVANNLKTREIRVLGQVGTSEAIDTELMQDLRADVEESEWDAGASQQMIEFSSFD
jgi:hypothetical protein